ncbi:trypsin-like peptidase domain-containing protein [Vibrio pelagius]|nr:trypsin-like peptidase domain-containing protein [Vibrio pelagius]
MFIGEPVTHVGYPMTRGPIFNAGHYIGEINIATWQGCTMSATTGRVRVGMSGGGVYNQSGELVGVNHGYIPETVRWHDFEYHQPSVFVPLLAVSDWLTEVTGKSFFD